jgi:hypothetical protein
MPRIAMRGLFREVPLPAGRYSNIASDAAIRSLVPILRQVSMPAIW